MVSGFINGKNMLREQEVLDALGKLFLIDSSKQERVATQQEAEIIRTEYGNMLLEQGYEPPLLNPDYGIVAVRIRKLDFNGNYHDDESHALQDPQKRRLLELVRETVPRLHTQILLGYIHNQAKAMAVMHGVDIETPPGTDSDDTTKCLSYAVSYSCEAMKRASQISFGKAGDIAAKCINAMARTGLEMPEGLARRVEQEQLL